MAWLLLLPAFRIIITGIMVVIVTIHTVVACAVKTTIVLYRS
jgi:hypothetical protein